MSRWTDALEKLDPCEDGMAWAKGFNTRQAAWEACENPQWMLWYLHKIGTDRKLMVLLACDCAATALPIWRKKHPNDDRPAKAIRVARAWTRGKATNEQVREARTAAYAAYAAANAADAAANAAAYAAVYAAYAAYAAYATANAANAAYATANAAVYTAADAAANAAYDARTKANRRMANLIRKRVPKLGRNPESTE